MKKCFVFPGQGAQSIGMGKELYDSFASAKDVFNEVDSALDFSLSSLIFSGEEAELNLTENTQPALMATSMAVIKVLEKDFDVSIANVADYVAGHSLGEYSALCAAGALDIATTAKLLQTRGQAMQKAVPAGKGSMAAVLGLDFDTVVTVTAQASHEGSVCSAANDNIAGQVVISGHAEAVERAIVLAKEAGAKRAIPLTVSAPFHCGLMLPAAEKMAEVLQNTAFNVPSVPVITNVTATAVSDVESIKKGLIEQVCGRVRWRESLQYMIDNNVSVMVESGAGAVLTGMIRRLDGLDGIKLNVAAEIEAFAKSL